MANVTLALSYLISRSSSPYRVPLCQGVNGSLATMTHIKRITYMIDKYTADIIMFMC